MKVREEHEEHSITILLKSMGLSSNLIQKYLYISEMDYFIHQNEKT